MEQVSGAPGFHPSGRVYGRRCSGPVYRHHPLQGPRHGAGSERDRKPYGLGQIPDDGSGRYRKLVSHIMRSNYENENIKL